MEDTSSALKTIRIRLEACSCSMEADGHDPLAIMLSNRSSRGTSLQAVIGRAVTKVETENRSVVENINIGDRLCSLVNLSYPISGNLQTEIEISPYASYKFSLDINPVDCAAVLPPCVQIYTAIHTLARLRKGESVLIACSNDLNLTCLAIQICTCFGLHAYVLVSDDDAISTASRFIDAKNLFKLDGMDSDSLFRTCNSFSDHLGFDCILDFGNNCSDTLGQPQITFSLLVRLVAAFGRIVTERNGQTIPKSDVNVLHLKSSSVHFLYDQIWHLSPLHYGRYKHLLADIIQKLASGKLTPVIAFEADPTKVEEAFAKHDTKLGCTVFKC